jgi:hypothetical protein
MENLEKNLKDVLTMVKRLDFPGSVHKELGSTNISLPRSWLPYKTREEKV